MNRIPALVAICKQKIKNKEAFLTWDALDSLLSIIKVSAHKKDGGRLLVVHHHHRHDDRKE